MLSHRYSSIDFLRFISIIGMIFTHTFRLLDLNNLKLVIPTLDTYFLEIGYSIMKIEPIIAALFLFTSGFSIFNKDVSNKKLYKIIIISIFLSIFIDSGIYFYRMLFSSTILFTIALSYILQQFRSKYNIKSIYLILMIGILSFIQDHFALSITGFNVGGGASIPILGFSFLGSFFREIDIKKISLNKRIIYFALSSITMTALLFKNLVFTINSEQYGFNLENNQIGLYSFSNWNLSFYGYLFNIFAVSFLYIFVLFLDFKNNQTIEKISKNSLSIYVFHLLIVGICYLFSNIFQNIYLVLLTFSIITILSYLFARFNDQKKLF